MGRPIFSIRRLARIGLAAFIFTGDFMRNCSIASCTYDASSGNPNPNCWCVGTVDGVISGAIAVTYQTIMQAYQVGGTAAVKSVLAPVLRSALGPKRLPDGTFQNAPYPPIPVYSSPVAPAPQNLNTNVVVTSALVPLWQQ
jgi:hypothetical protein